MVFHEFVLMPKNKYSLLTRREYYKKSDNTDFYVRLQKLSIATEDWKGAIKPQEIFYILKDSL